MTVASPATQAPLSSGRLPWRYFILGSLLLFVAVGRTLILESDATVDVWHAKSAFEPGLSIDQAEQGLPVGVRLTPQVWREARWVPVTRGEFARAAQSRRRVVVSSRDLGGPFAAFYALVDRQGRIITVSELHGLPSSSS